MNKNIILVAETGSDLTPELAAEYGIKLVPMHVSIGNETLDDGTFPISRIFEYYEETKNVPKTSASSPMDFEVVFDEIHEQYPDRQILHLAYSAVTTCSYQNAVIAAQERDYVTSLDTQHVSVGQAFVVKKVAQYLSEHPECELEEAVEYAKKICASTNMCFIPNNLDFLRAGGRVSNATALVGNLLSIHPCIEIEDGKLVAKRKYRGKTEKIIPKLIHDFVEANQIDVRELYFIHAPGLSDEAKEVAQKTAHELGCQNTIWMSTGCVISCHGGPGAFGIVGMTKGDA